MAAEPKTPPTEESASPLAFLRWMAVVVGVLLSVALVLRLRAPAPGAQAVPDDPDEPAPPSLVVLGFDTPEGSEWEGTALADLVILRLEQSPSVRVVPAERVAHWRLERGWSGIGDPSPGQLVNLGRIIHADAALLGSITGSTVQGRLIELDTSEVLGTFSVAAEGLVARADGVTQKLPSPYRPADGAVLSSSDPPPGAIASYYRGLLRLRRFHFRDALGELEVSRRAAPEYAPAALAMAEAQAALGRPRRAADSARQALQLAPTLSEFHRSLIEARASLLLGDASTAASRLSTLAAARPDDPEIGLARVHALRLAGRRGESVATLEKLRSSRDTRGDPRFDLAEAALAQDEEPDRALSVTRRAAERARVLDSRLVLALARGVEASVLMQQDRRSEAVEAFEEVARLTAALDPAGHAAALEGAAGATSDPDRARAQLAVAAAAYRDLGASRLAMAPRLGFVRLLSRGAGEATPEPWEELAGEACRIGDLKTHATALVELGHQLRRAGDFVGVERIVGALESLDEPGTEVAALELAGWVHWERDPATAAEIWREAVARMPTGAGIPQSDPAPQSRSAERAPRPPLSADPLRGCSGRATPSRDPATARAERPDGRALAPARRPQAGPSERRGGGPPPDRAWPA